MGTRANNWDLSGVLFTRKLHAMLKDREKGREEGHRKRSNRCLQQRHSIIIINRDVIWFLSCHPNTSRKIDEEPRHLGLPATLASDREIRHMTQGGFS